MSGCEVGLNVSECEDHCGLRIRSACYRCGGPACRACSRLVIWRGKRIRMCNDCLESEPEREA